MHRPPKHRQGGFSLMEITVFIVVVSLAVPPLVSLLYQTLAGKTQTHMQTAAVHLARGLLEEIRSKNFEDPEGAEGSFGTEESSRADYDDVDDYDGLDESPPCDSLGNPLSQFSGFRTRVTVENVSAEAPGGDAQADGSTNFKRITVRVDWENGSRFVRLQALVSKAPTGGGTSVDGLTFISRTYRWGGPRFYVRNDSGQTLYLTNMIVTWSSPEAYYDEIEMRVEGGSNYGKVWDADHHYDYLMGSGENAMFNEGDIVEFPAGATMRIDIDDFYRTRHWGGWIDMRFVTFTVEIWAGPIHFTPFTVPSL